MPFCARCGKEHAPDSKSWNDEDKKCTDVEKCSKRATTRMLKTTVQRRFVGFDPDREYRRAPKLGDSN